MDYRGIKAGATLYFPVFVPGALLHLGDGHAVQGDGEIVGTGIETTFDVQFTVRLLKGRQINWPRGENADYIFTLGNARPLDQALQHATTEMLLWLEEDYGLSAPAASTLLGMCVEYEVGNIYDPAYTMVCKLPKHLLGARVSLNSHRSPSPGPFRAVHPPARRPPVERGHGARPVHYRPRRGALHPAHPRRPAGGPPGPGGRRAGRFRHRRG